jgi:hypothetical protein
MPFVVSVTIRYCAIALELETAVEDSILLSISLWQTGAVANAHQYMKVTDHGYICLTVHYAPAATYISDYFTKGFRLTRLR